LEESSGSIIRKGASMDSRANSTERPFVLREKRRKSLQGERGERKGSLCKKYQQEVQRKRKSSGGEEKSGGRDGKKKRVACFGVSPEGERSFPIKGWVLKW